MEKNKLESFNRATEGQGGGPSGVEVKNRYIVGVEEEVGEGGKGIESNAPSLGNNGDELAMYTNISDFKAEKSKKKQRKKKNSGDETFDDLGTGLDGDLAAFKESLKRKKNAPKKNKNLVMNNASAQLPGTELGVYDENETKGRFVGGGF